MCMKKKSPTPKTASSLVEEAAAAYVAAPTETRTNIVMEEPLVAEAQAITGIKTKTGVVHHALRELVRRSRQKEVLAIRGKVEFWDGYAAEHINA